MISDIMDIDMSAPKSIALSRISGADYVGSKVQNGKQVQLYRSITYEGEDGKTKRSELRSLELSDEDVSIALESIVAMNEVLFIMQNKREEELLIKDVQEERKKHRPFWKLGVLDFEGLGLNLRVNFFNPAYLMLVKDILNTILSGELNYERSTREKIKMWLKNVYILSSGSYGGTFVSGINSIDQFFAIKFSSNPEVTLRHEYLIGKEVNKLRERNRTPNLMYTYGIFRTGVMIKDDKDIVTWTEGNEEETFIVLENIADSISLKQHLTDTRITFDNYMPIFFQLFFTLIVAYEDIEFTHWDLHTNNILISENKISNKWFKYDVKIGSYTVKIVDVIPTIIDFGFSSANIGGNLMGPLAGTTSSHFTGVSILLEDVYKILLFSYFSLLKKKMKKSVDGEENILIEFLKQLLLFFFEDGKESLQKMSDRLEDLELLDNINDKTYYAYLWYYKLPLSYSKRSIQEFFDIVLSYLKEYNYDSKKILLDYSKSKSKSKRVQLLSCSEIKCSTQIQLEKTLTISPDNYKQACYSGSNLRTLTDTEQQILKNKATEEYNNIIEEIKKEHNFLNHALNNIHIIDVLKRVQTYSEAKNIIPDILNVIAYYNYSLLYIWSYFSDLRNIYNNIRCVEDLGLDYPELKIRLEDSINEYSIFKSRYLDNNITNIYNNFKRITETGTSGTIMLYDSNYSVDYNKDKRFSEFYEQWNIILALLTLDPTA